MSYRDNIDAWFLAIHQPKELYSKKEYSKEMIQRIRPWGRVLSSIAKMFKLIQCASHGCKMDEDYHCSDCYICDKLNYFLYPNFQCDEEGQRGADSK